VTAAGASGFALKFISGKYQGGEFPLKAEKNVVIGRSSELDMVLVEDMVSRKHAKIAVNAGKITIEDLRKLVRQGSNVAELDEAQVKANLENIGQAQAAKQTKTAMTGKLEEVPLPDLLQLFHTSKKNGVLAVTNEHEAKIYLRQGKVYYACIDDNHDLGPAKSFNRIITWETGDFELRPPDNQEFMVELDTSTEALLMDSLRQLDELKRIQPELPPADSGLSVNSPLTAPLRDLTPDHLDVLQLAHNWGTVQGVLDHSEKDDLTVSTLLLELLQREYLRGA
jgi:hypothetical protein